MRKSSMKKKATALALAVITTASLVTGMLPNRGLRAAEAKDGDVLENVVFVGDVDGDGSITPKDVTKMRRFLAGGWDVEVAVEDGDVDEDGAITPKDVTKLRRYLAGGWGVELPKKNTSTETPTEAPTEQPTEAPTEQPTEAPTEQPTEAPTEQPTEAPTEQPTETPTEKPLPVVEYPVAIDEEHFPDEIFKGIIINEFDTDHDTYLSKEEADQVGLLNIPDAGISDLKGVECFSNLGILICPNNNISELDLRCNTEIFSLICAYNNLSSLNISNNPKLENLNCLNNKLSELKLTSKNIRELYCGLNQLKSIELGDNDNLEIFNIEGNPLEKIPDIKKFENLKILNFSNLGIEDLDVNENIQLEALYCANNKLTNLDISNLRKLKVLDCSDNSIEKLDLSNKGCLNSLKCSKNLLKSIDISECYGLDPKSYDIDGNPNLAVDSDVEIIDNYIPIDVNETNFPSAGFRGFITFNLDKNHDGQISKREYASVDGTLESDLEFKISNIDCDDNGVINLTGIELFKNLKVLSLDNLGYDSMIESIDLSQNTVLEKLSIKNFKMSVLDLSKNVTLKEISIADSEVGTVNLDGLSSLEKLEVKSSENRTIEKVVLGDNTALETINIFGYVADFDLSKAANLKRLNVREDYGSESIDLSNNVSLEYFECWNTKLKEVDLSNNSTLISATCNFNTELEKLNINGAAALTSLNCSECKLSSLDVSSNQNLEYLDCTNNQITSLDVSKTKLIEQMLRVDEGVTVKWN